MIATTSKTKENDLVLDTESLESCGDSHGLVGGREESGGRECSLLDMPSDVLCHIGSFCTAKTLSTMTLLSRHLAFGEGLDFMGTVLRQRFSQLAKELLSKEQQPQWKGRRRSYKKDIRNIHTLVTDALENLNPTIANNNNEATSILLRKASQFCAVLDYLELGQSTGDWPLWGGELELCFFKFDVQLTTRRCPLDQDARVLYLCHDYLGTNHPATDMDPEQVLSPLLFLDDATVGAVEGGPRRRTNSATASTDATETFVAYAHEVSGRYYEASRDLGYDGGRMISFSGPYHPAFPGKPQVYMSRVRDISDHLMMLQYEEMTNTVLTAVQRRQQRRHQPAAAILSNQLRSKHFDLKRQNFCFVLRPNNYTAFDMPLEELICDIMNKRHEVK